MKQITEIDLHLYVVNKSLLAHEILHEIEQRVTTDKKLAEDIEEIKEYYQNYDAFNIEDELKMFILIPLNIESVPDEKLTLAAQQIAPALARSKYIKTFISSEKYVLVRMFRDYVKNEYVFYVICENESSVKDAVIKIPSINMEIKTDDMGIAKISAEYIPDDVELTVVLN